MPLPKRILLAVTSEHTTPFFSNGAPTGVFYCEVSHPLKVFSEAGFQVDIVTEDGKTSGFDPHSLDKDFMDPETMEAFRTGSDTYNIRNTIEKGENLLSANHVDPSMYGIFFAAGGHGTCFDFPKATGLQRLADAIYQQGGIVAAICHGPVIFKNLKNSATNDFLVKGIKVTGFTKAGEVDLKVDDIMKKLGLETCEDIVQNHGGTYVSPPRPYDDFSIEDQRIVTGANPASATSCAQLAIDSFNKSNK